MNFQPGSKQRSVSVVDLTPLIDIVFLLLIFFLITTTFVRRHEMVVTINLPSGSAQEVAPEEEELTIFVEPSGRFLVRSDPDSPELELDYDALREELDTLYETDPDLAIFLRGDRDVNYGAVIDILLMSREIGFQRVQAVIRDDRPLAPPEE